MAKIDSSRLESCLNGYRPFWVIILLSYALDQLTKWIVVTHDALPIHSYPGRINPGIEVINGFFYLVHVGNRGAAWSLFSDYSFFLGLLAVCALMAIWIFRRAIALSRPCNQLAIGLISGGILGNLTDRITRGEVVDFLLFRFGNWDYPVFNVADSTICVGVIIYIIANWNQPAPQKSPSSPDVGNP